MLVLLNNKQEIFEILDHLDINAIPLFGKMTAQHMIEHICGAVIFSNGKLPQKLYYPVDKAAAMKNILIYSDKEFPHGFKAPMLTDDLPSLVFPDLPTAIGRLSKQMDNFHQYFEQNPGSKPIHPALGELDYKDWTTFHNKHFTHHFKQFGLI